MLEFKNRDQFEKTVAEDIMADMKSCHEKSEKIHLDFILQIYKFLF